MGLAVAANGQIDSGYWDRNSEIDLMVKQSLSRIVSQMKIDTVIRFDTTKVIIYYRYCNGCRVRRTKGYRYKLIYEQHRRIDNMVFVSSLLNRDVYIYLNTKNQRIPQFAIVRDKVIKTKKHEK